MINFTLTTGEEIEALPVRRESDGTIYVFVDCLCDEYPMNKKSTNEGGYDASDLRKILNSDILCSFPVEIKDHLIPFDNGDLLRIPTEKEIFGENPYGEEEPETTEQFEAMVMRRNRIAFQGKNGDWEWYWLQNKMRDSATGFACVYAYGGAGSSGASYSYGVRPCFKLSHN